MAGVWTVQWHRHDWIPGDLPIGSLNLATDARSILSGLDRVVVPEPVEAEVPGLRARAVAGRAPVTPDGAATGRDDAQAEASVFGSRDQDQIIAHIDTVSEDDLSSTFFGDSIQEVEDAATRMFDVGHPRPSP